MFPQPDARRRRERWDDNRAVVDQAHVLRADCLVLVCGVAYADLAGARQQVVSEGIAELEPYAGSASRSNRSIR